MPLSLLGLLILGLGAAMCENSTGWSRAHLTEEIQKLSLKVGQIEREKLSEDIAHLGRTLAEAQEKLGEKLGEALGALAEDLAGRQVEGLEALGATLGDKLADGLSKLGERLADESCRADGSVLDKKAPPESCVDVQKYDKSNSVHTLTVNTRRVQVFCDQHTAQGGWTVIQRRRDGSVNFFREWAEYQRGFGDLDGEFWLGLENIHQLTSGQKQELRVDLEDFEGNVAYAEYGHFNISGKDDFYRLHIGSFFAGNAGDSLGLHDNMQFSAKDKDNDKNGGNCANAAHGAWWYKTCFRSNLNGRYKHAADTDSYGVSWYTWKNSHVNVKRAEMKIRPVQ